MVVDEKVQRWMMHCRRAVAFLRDGIERRSRMTDPQCTMFSVKLVGAGDSGRRAAGRNKVDWLP